ncbi:BolA family protein [Salpingoeca rosetta]|uniref:BolA family protein n=1 Tax=Salpingoeca rosetta (strain ATCC 50818 / BSB-021) TaxID=946362 RepID=F2ULV8_SALR5|nr:BolA family protein [Salpingoeca rosetta]EGD78107.1 BolA family protein [Salpingoeca rosetta]|eukprot:XP_004989783.1 BolA family protein [Salpingoeca rosetta]
MSLRAVVAASRRLLHTTPRTAMGVVEDAVREKLTARFKPQHLEIINESFKHNVPKGSETHFKVIIVAPEFEGMPLIKRSREVYATLDKEMAGPIHALSITARTPAQWEKNANVSPTPNCLGGNKL